MPPIRPETPQVNLESSGWRQDDHDPWNRLVKLTIAADDVGSYQYYGTHARSVRLLDTTEPTDGTLDERRHLYYSPDWRLLEERIDQGYTGSFATDVVAQQAWGIRGLDDAVLRRRRDAGDDWDDLLSRQYYLTDVQLSPLALIEDSAALAERIAYMPYGPARHSRPREVDGEGMSLYEYPRVESFCPGPSSNGSPMPRSAVSGGASPWRWRRPSSGQRPSRSTGSSAARSCWTATWPPRPDSYRLCRVRLAVRLAEG